MLIKYWARPVLTLFGILGSMLVLGDMLSGMQQRLGLFSASVPHLMKAVLFGGSALTISVGLWLAYCAYRTWKWKNMEGELCHQCGGIVREKSGRWGPYVKCVGCGAKRKITK